MLAFRPSLLLDIESPVDRKDHIRVKRFIQSVSALFSASTTRYFTLKGPGLLDKLKLIEQGRHKTETE